MFEYFNHGTMRRMVIVFGSMFNDINVQRYDNNGNRIQTLAVPLAYGPKQKFLVRLDTDPNLDREVAISLPRMGFELTGITYDGTRKLNTTRKNTNVSTTDDTVNLSQYTPVPYNLDFVLSIFVKNADDGTQILEQILPYFKPEWNIEVNMISSMNIKMDIPTILNSVSFQDVYDGDYQSRRSIIWDLNFTMKSYFYGPVNTSGVITRSQIDIRPEIALDTPRVERLTLVPGLLANGSPTTDSSLSVDRNQINSGDDFGFAEDIFEFQDGKVFNPVTGQDELP